MNSATNDLSRVEGPQASDEKPALDNTLIEASRQILKQKTQLSRDRLLTPRNNDMLNVCCLNLLCGHLLRKQQQLTDTPFQMYKLLLKVPEPHSQAEPTHTG